jgi:hypothetical protein
VLYRDAASMWSTSSVATFLVALRALVRIMGQGGSREKRAQGAPGRVRAAAEPGDGRVERAHGRVERSTTVRDAYAVRVVELLSLA